MSNSPTDVSTGERFSKFTTRTLYRDFRRHFRVPEGKLLALSEKQFKAALTHFVGLNAPHLIPTIRFAGGDRTLKPRRQAAEERPFPWSPFDPQIVSHLETLQLRMHFAVGRPDQYDSAKREFDKIIRRCLPRRPRKHAANSNLIGFAEYLAKRIFLWSVLKGEWNMLSEMTSRTGQKLGMLRTQYAYTSRLYGDDVLGDTLAEKLNVETAKDLAVQDTASHYCVSSDSVIAYLSPAQFGLEKAN